MKSIIVLMRNAIAVAALVSSLVTVSAAQPAASTRRNNEPLDESTYPFEFHSGFWINLHHFLFEQALLRRRATNTAQPTTQLSTEQRQLWNAALDYYASTMIKRDFVHDEDMATTNDLLAKAETAGDLRNSGVSADLIKVLESVAPLYRARWWPQHDRANRFWIAVVTPMVRQFNRTLVNQLAAAYQAKWPADLIRVDVVEYANWAGAFTTFDRTDRVHITIGSMDSGNQGFSALEILFHESSHSMVGPRNGAVARAIARECQARNKPIPDSLWHAVIFYTSGEFIKRNLNEYGVSDYTPVAYRGIYARSWPNLQRPLELYWQPYLEGKVDFDKAMSNLIDAL